MSLRTTMTTSEKVIQKSMTRPRRSVHHTSFLWALCHELVRSTTQRFPICSKAGSPFSEISKVKPRDRSFARVVSESYPRSRCTLICSGSGPSTSRVFRVSPRSGESWRLAEAATVPRGFPRHLQP